MSSRIISGANRFFAQQQTQSGEWANYAHLYPRGINQPGHWMAAARTVLKGLVATAHNALLVLGVSAITALCMMFFNPNLADRLKALSPFAEADVQKPQVIAPPLSNLMDTPKPAALQTASLEAAPIAVLPVVDAITSREQRWVTNWLSKRYHVAGDAANLLVSASYAAARDTDLDPLLILAVMSIESGLNPFAESAMGAQGLMQVMSKVHHDKFEDLGGVKAALNPVANIKVGALILKDYVTRGGSIEAGLKLYVGAAAFDNDAGYGSKVMAEYHRLKDVSIGKNVPTISPIMTTALKQRSSDMNDNVSEAQPDAQADSAAHDGKQLSTQFASL